MKKIDVRHLGLISYQRCWDEQKKLLLQRQQDEISDTLLLVEHPPTYTLGKGGDAKHMLADEKILQEIKAVFVHTDRGGDITFHGPGQLVAYPILKLRELKLDVHAYLRQLEEVTIQVLAQYGIHASRVQGMTGVWVNEAKIAAIGVRLSRWVSMHGIAINLNVDLNYFKYIVPCGIASKPVTSLKQLLGKKVDEAKFTQKFVQAFLQVFKPALEKSVKTAV